MCYVFFSIARAPTFQPLKLLQFIQRHVVVNCISMHLYDQLFCTHVFVFCLLLLFVQFGRPGTMKTQILAESGIKIKKSTKSRPELPRERFWESFSVTFEPTLGLWGRLWTKNGFQSACQKKVRKKVQRVSPSNGSGRP